MDRESYLPPVQIGEPMRAGCVAQVVKSNHPDFSVGQMVQATNGWQDYAVVDPAHPPSSLRPMPEGRPGDDAVGAGCYRSHSLFWITGSGRSPARRDGAGLGRGGCHGFRSGQIAKIKGCRVVGIAGGPQKCAWLTEEAGFDHAIDYKQGNSISRSLRPAQRSGMCSSTTSVAIPSRRR
ncbi:MAG: hypothetical protein CM15mP74_05260 [Halieaceae bacterium]|nr:MAG: hypothetical protein CM15mP74_05260 [Halieaceae bacterium]